MVRGTLRKVGYSAVRIAEVFHNNCLRMNPSCVDFPDAGFLLSEMTSGCASFIRSKIVWKLL